MELQVNVNVELGAKTIAFLVGSLLNQAAEESPKERKALPKAEPAQEEMKIEEQAPKRRTAKEIAEQQKAVTNGWDEMGDDEKLDSIKAEVTKHTKKGKSADIRAILKGFDAERASVLDPSQYSAFYDAIKAYGEGSTVDDVIAKFGVSCDDMLS